MDDTPQVAIAAPQLVGPNGDMWPTARRWYTWRSLVLRRLPFLGDVEFPCVRRHLYRDWDGTTPWPVDWVLCAAALLRRDALDEIGLMDARFPIYFGDVDLALRARKAGWGVWIVPDAEVVHLWQRASRRWFTAAWFSHLASLAVFVRKHRGLGPRRVDPAPGRRSRPSFGSG